MKYIKKFENNKEIIELVIYPQGDIIDVTKHEIDSLIALGFNIYYDDELDYYHHQKRGQWIYNSEDNNDDYDDIDMKEILNLVRNGYNKSDIEIFKKLKKYNL